MARVTYILLMGFEGKDGAPAFPSLNTLAYLLKRQRKVAQGYLSELESSGWLDKKKFKNKDGQFQAIRYDLLRHRRAESDLRPKGRKRNTVKPTTENPTTEKCPTNDSQSYQFPEITNTKRIEGSNGALPESIANILATRDTRLVFDRVNWLRSLEQLLGPTEWKARGAMWRNRANCGGEVSAKALRNATEDFFILTPDQRSEIRNRDAWITDKYTRECEKLKAIRK